MRFSKRYAALFLIVLAIEVIIALYFKENIIRPFLGDFLVVALIYFFWMTFVKVPPAYMAIAVFLFAVTVEVAQYFNLANVLGVQDNKVASLVLGSTFDPIDLLMYFFGIWTVLFFEFRKISNS